LLAFFAPEMSLSASNKHFLVIEINKIVSRRLIRVNIHLHMRGGIKFTKGGTGPKLFAGSQIV
jgi:hypothetical protein